jgi:phosphoglycerate dehydrogenase-like enzyme
MIGDVDGDRFAHRIDLGAAAARDIIVVDTTHGSAASVAEWTLALMLIALRNAGALFRRLIAGEPVMVSASDWRGDASFRNGELFNKRVGLIGCGHIGRRLLELVEPFSVKTMVSDPHLPKVMADAYGFEFGDLDQVLSENEVVVCLAPLTERTRGMIGARELALLKPGSVFVNSSRGAIVDSAALIERLAKGDIVAALDVFDPEPIPTDSPIRSAPNAFVSPHIAANVWQAEPRCFNLMLDEVERLAAGREPLNALVAVGRPQGGLVPVLRD